MSIMRAPDLPTGERVYLKVPKSTYERPGPPMRDRGRLLSVSIIGTLATVLSLFLVLRAPPP